MQQPGRTKYEIIRYYFSRKKNRSYDIPSTSFQNDSEPGEGRDDATTSTTVGALLDTIQQVCCRGFVGCLHSCASSVDSNLKTPPPPFFFLDEDNDGGHGIRTSRARHQHDFTAKSAYRRGNHL